jgi:glucose/arabinose dehydrogenase
MRLAAGIALAIMVGAAPALKAQDSRSDWEVRPGFSLRIDADGFHYPTAIAFVPQPGPGPKDPLYFVTELRGRVKVVTNDRTIYTFAEGLSPEVVPSDLPDDYGEHGVAGICLEPSHGYVFVTVARVDSQNIMRNEIVRFETRPRTFSIEPASRVSFANIFADFPSSYSHQIGPCEVVGETMFVSVGDAHESVQSQYLASPLGKVLRMTLDGRPVASNPFYKDDDIRKPENFVWALGFRNPFSLEPVRGHVFVADNGINADRFIEIERGVNYGWDGTDKSLTVNTLLVYAPAASPTSMQFYPEDSDLFPSEYHDRFYLVLAGKLVTEGPGRFGERSISTLDYDFERKRMRGPSELFVRYRGPGTQVPVGMAFGPDGLYFASILPASSGTSPIYKVAHDPANEHAFVIGRTTDPVSMMADKQCLGCHQIAERGGQVGPALDAADLVARLEARLSTPEYAASLAALDSLNMEPFASHAASRREVLAATGRERVRVWLRYRLLEPRFDAMAAAMPRPGLTDAQARILADYLMTEPEPAAQPASGLLSRLRQAVPPSRHRYTVLAFLAGLAAALVLGRLLRRAGRT